MTRHAKRVQGVIAALAASACVSMTAQDGTVIQKTEGGTVTMKPVAPKIDTAELFAFLPEVVAKYGDQKITKAEVLKYLEPQMKMMAMYGQKPKPEDCKEMAGELVKELVNVRILLGIADKAGYKVTPAIADEEFKKFTAQFEKNNSAGGGKAPNFEELIKQQGMTVEDFKKQIGEAATIKKWIDEKLVPTLGADDAEALKYYNENKENFKKPETIRASHILIKIEDDAELAKKIADAKKEISKLKKDGADSKAQEAALATLEAQNKDAAGKGKDIAKAKAEKLLADIKAGADFAKIAQTESACPSGKRDGDLGDFGKNKMTPTFESAAWKLKVGELSGVVETPFGFHIIKKTAESPEGYENFAELKDKIQMKMKSKGVDDKLKAMVDEETAKVKPEFFLGDAAPAATPVAPAPAPAAPPAPAK